MRSLKINAGRCRHRASGFSLIEMTTVVALTIVVSVISVISLMPLLNAQHVVNAYNTTLSVMRQARDNAASQRTSYSVTFQNTTVPNSITVAWAPVTGESNMGELPTTTYTFPNNVVFAVPPSGVTAPDNYGSGSSAIDFGYTASSSAGGATVIYFCPDGSAQTSNACAGAGNWDGGVVYFGLSGDGLSWRAVDLWGATGRIHGWRLYPKTGGGGNYQWLRQ
jgi:type II secretory pathway pseudopilin PulG